MSEKDLSIIIVDDLQFSRIVVKTALKKAGFDGVRMADSASMALQMLDDEPADVVLADWMMPEMDGLELTHRIRQLDEDKGIYTGIILFTANEGIEYLVKAFDHGVDDYILKPPNPHELAARVSATARIAAMQNDLLETSRHMQKTIKRLQQSCLVDSLTGAGNERLLQTELHAHLSEASSRKGGVCLALIEIADFEHILSKHPEEVINEIIVGLYTRLRRTVRPTDVIARIDENLFAVIMHHTRTAIFKMSAVERIANAINQRPFKIEDKDLRLRCYIGIHYYRGEEALVSVNEMIKFARNNLNETRKTNSSSLAD